MFSYLVAAYCIYRAIEQSKVLVIDGYVRSLFCLLQSDTRFGNGIVLNRA